METVQSLQEYLSQVAKTISSCGEKPTLTTFEILTVCESYEFEWSVEKAVEEIVSYRNNQRKE
jgi:hypothetical protein